MKTELLLSAAESLHLLQYFVNILNPKISLCPDVKAWRLQVVTPPTPDRQEDKCQILHHHLRLF